VPKLDKEIVSFPSRSVGWASKTMVYGSIGRNIHQYAGSEWIPRIDPSALRYYSSPEGAEARRLRAAKSRGPGDRSRYDQRGQGRPHAKGPRP
jgi:hypothetical protein